MLPCQTVSRAESVCLCHTETLGEKRAPEPSEETQSAAESGEIVHKINLKIGSERDANLVQSRCPKVKKLERILRRGSGEAHGGADGCMDGSGTLLLQDREC